MILGRDGAKLSKRHGAVDIRNYERQGYLPDLDLDEFDEKATKENLRPVILEPLRAAREKPATTPERDKGAIPKAIGEVAASFKLNMGKLGQPIRVALTGGSVSPPIDVTVFLVGRERVLSRLDRALGFIEARASTSI